MGTLNETSRMSEDRDRLRGSEMLLAKSSLLNALCGLRPGYCVGYRLKLPPDPCTKR